MEIADLLKEDWPWIALAYIAVTIIFTVWVGNRTKSTSLWHTALLGGLLLPGMTFIGGLAWFLILPEANKGGNGMLLAVIAVVAAYSLPPCLLVAAITAAVRRF